MDLGAFSKYKEPVTSHGVASQAVRRVQEEPTKIKEQKKEAAATAKAAAEEARHFRGMPSQIPSQCQSFGLDGCTSCI